ncbi:hypothetical protein SCACP_20070 [Sporomusa carbonis]|uniref:hypothetical protein n=1 Tax=Sporomusa carbonis TaxID=3076075 RepID=UPI003A6FCA98
MRLRKYHRTTGLPSERPATIVEEQVATESQVSENKPAVLTEIPQKAQAAKGPAALFRKIIENPNFNIQLMVILLTLASENFAMDRRIDSMSSAVDKIRNVTEVINSTMQSVKVATDAPRKIRRLFEQQ